MCAFKYQLGFATTSGRRGGENEDSAIQYIPQDALTLGNKGALFAIADGLGGYNAGQVASQLALQTLVSTYYRDTNNDLPFSLERAVLAANQAVWDQSMRVAKYNGMATTLTAVVVRSKEVFIANVGDSRAYLARQARLIKITRDHSYAAELGAMAGLSPAQVRRHPLRRNLSRAIGQNSTVKVDLFRGTATPNDTFFLCTDGLSDWTNEREMANVLSRRLDVMSAARDLTTRAFQHGSDDNVTSYVVRLAPAQPAGSPGITARPTTRLPHGSAAVHGRGAIAAASPTQLIYAFTLAIVFWLFTWAVFFAMIIAGRVHR